MPTKPNKNKRDGGLDSPSREPLVSPARRSEQAAMTEAASVSHQAGKFNECFRSAGTSPSSSPLHGGLQGNDGVGHPLAQDALPPSQTGPESEGDLGGGSGDEAMTTQTFYFANTGIQNGEDRLASSSDIENADTEKRCKDSEHSARGGGEGGGGGNRLERQSSVVSDSFHAKDGECDLSRSLPEFAKVDKLMDAVDQYASTRNALIGDINSNEPVTYENIYLRVPSQKSRGRGSFKTSLSISECENLTRSQSWAKEGSCTGSGAAGGGASGTWQSDTNLMCNGLNRSARTSRSEQSKHHSLLSIFSFTPPKTSSKNTLLPTTASVHQLHTCPLAPGNAAHLPMLTADLVDFSERHATAHNLLALGIVALVVGCVSILLSLTSPGMAMWRYVGAGALFVGLVLCAVGGIWYFVQCRVLRVGGGRERGGPESGLGVVKAKVLPTTPPASQMSLKDVGLKVSDV